MNVIIVLALTLTSKKVSVERLSERILAASGMDAPETCTRLLTPMWYTPYNISEATTLPAALSGVSFASPYLHTARPAQSNTLAVP